MSECFCYKLSHLLVHIVHMDYPHWGSVCLAACRSSFRVRNGRLASLGLRGGDLVCVACRGCTCLEKKQKPDGACLPGIRVVGRRWGRDRHSPRKVPLLAERDANTPSMACPQSSGAVSKTPQPANRYLRLRSVRRAGLAPWDPTGHRGGKVSIFCSYSSSRAPAALDWQLETLQPVFRCGLRAFECQRAPALVVVNSLDMGQEGLDSGISCSNQHFPITQDFQSDPPPDEIDILCPCPSCCPSLSCRGPVSGAVVIALHDVLLCHVEHSQFHPSFTAWLHLIGG